MYPTIMEVYKITDDEIEVIENKGEESEYWMNCYEFIVEILDKTINQLSEKQIDWLERILSDIRN